MEKYRNINNNSDIEGYECGEDWIFIIFTNGDHDKYTYGCVGYYNLEKMKKLADRGSGLNSFINLNIKNKINL